MPKINNIVRLLTKLKALQKKADSERKLSVVVGYTQSYAVYVHENTSAEHPVGNAKFLEGPARRLAPILSETIRAVAEQTGSLAKGLLVAGLRLQRESQMEVPVDTSALKASAFTAIDPGSDKMHLTGLDTVEEAASKAFALSEKIRKASKK